MANREAWHRCKHCCRCARYTLDMLDLPGCFFVRFSSFPHVQTCTDSSIKESHQERQQNAAEVEDLRKQLSKAAAEACLHWLALALPHCVR